VCSPSCHDTTTFRAWFEEDENRRRKYYSQVLGEDISTTPKRCTTETMRKVVKQHLESPSALAIFALADVLAMDKKYINERDPNEETINDPTNSRHYWRFRFHTTLEDMKKNEQLTGELKKMVFESGRNVPK
jgi:4-alpha-glucanotransferase